MRYTFVVTLLICKGTFFFLKERTFLHHFYIIIGGDCLKTHSSQNVS